jgi:Kelch motif
MIRIEFCTAPLAGLLILGWLPLMGSNGQEPVKVQWELVTGRPGWQPRDSSGELVFKDRMWLLGGWFDSFSQPPRDVWSSRDGRQWELVNAEAPWRHSDLPMTIAYQDRMWLMGGWTGGRLPGHGASNEVWSSLDGREWTLETRSAGWSPRLAGGLVEFRGRMWIVGGTENYYFGDEASLKNDLWSSTDGVNWNLELSQAPWSPRGYHQVVVMDGRMWVMGGGNYVPEYGALNDVWSSADGIHWRCETERAAWSPRLWFSAVPFRDHLWVLGGWSKEPLRNWDDIWISRDGREWREVKSDPGWKARHEHSAYVLDDKLWIAAGHANPLSSEVWSLSLPKQWP